MEDKYKIRYQRIKILFWVLLVAIPLLIASRVLGSTTSTGSVLKVIAILFAVPFIIYVYCITILHWKDRYEGKHSDLWGILLLIETSGWFKIIYFFRHLLPDIQNKGRYEKTNANQELEPTSLDAD